MSRATPGPWVVTAQQEREEFNDGAHMDRVEVYIGEPGRLAHCGKHVAKVMGWGRDFDGDPEMQANARLICAAPDLLAACEAYIAASVKARCASGVPGLDSALASHERIHEMIRAAVAKARGEA